eukprot:438433-Amphidinium_carterae.1
MSEPQAELEEFLPRGTQSVRTTLIASSALAAFAAQQAIPKMELNGLLNRHAIHSWRACKARPFVASMIALLALPWQHTTCCQVQQASPKLLDQWLAERLCDVRTVDGPHSPTAPSKH